MKVIGFNSYVSGVGCTTLSMLLASFLAYEKREKVFYWGLDRSQSLVTDLRALEFADMESDKSRIIDYIRRRGIKMVTAYDFVNMDTVSDYDKFASLLKSLDGKYDYVILDFGQEYFNCEDSEKRLFSKVMNDGFLDLVVVPMQCLSSSVKGARRVINEVNGRCKNLCVWNNISYNSSKSSEYIFLRDYMNNIESENNDMNFHRGCIYNYPLIPLDFSFSDSFFMSTILYPKLDARYKNVVSSLEKFFKDIIKELSYKE